MICVSSHPSPKKHDREVGIMGSVKIRIQKHSRWQRVRGIVCSRRVWRWAAIVVLAIVLVQLVLPYDRAFLFARADDVPVGLKTEHEIAQILRDRYARATVITTQPDTKKSFIDVGLKVDADASARRVVEYPLWQRLIPLSMLLRLGDTEHPSRVTYLKLPLEQWASDISTACAKPARDASIEIREGALALSPSADGRECPKLGLIASLKQTPLAPELRVDTAAHTLKPKRGDRAVRSQITKVQKVIDQGITVTVLDATITAQTSEIVSWLTFSDGPDGQLKLDVDPGKVQAFVARVQAPVYIAPGTTSVSVRDGQETGRVVGAAGRGVDSGDLINQLRSRLQQQSSGAIVATLAVLPPREVFSRSYTNSTAGLQALLTDITTEHSNMAIALRELEGQQRTVSAGGDKQFHPASTYKLFMAHSVIKRIEANQLKWTDEINGTTVDECLTRMIVNSDNICAEAFAEKFTWGSVQSDLKSIGATGTNLNLPEPVGTVKDQVLFLHKLHHNQLMKQENKDKLLALMRQQRFRAGIPAGVGVTVANKVGFLGNNLHDSGLVYSGHGVYALSIYSTGGTWGAIADATRRIEALLAS